MITGFKFKQPFLNFNAEETIEFRPGVNFLVDENSGRSTLISLIRSFLKDQNSTFNGISFPENSIHIIYQESTLRCFDFERENLRTLSFNAGNDFFELQQISKNKSHSFLTGSLLSAIGSEENCLYIFDEPDAGLGLKTIKALGHNMKIAETKHCQIIAAVNNPLLMLSQKEIFSMKEKKFINTSYYIQESISSI
jgi:predicted ATPase